MSFLAAHPPCSGRSKCGVGRDFQTCWGLRQAPGLADRKINRSLPCGSLSRVSGLRYPLRYWLPWLSPLRNSKGMGKL